MLSQPRIYFETEMTQRFINNRKSGAEMLKKNNHNNNKTDFEGRVPDDVTFDLRQFAKNPDGKHDKFGRFECQI